MKFLVLFLLFAMVTIEVSCETCKPDALHKMFYAKLDKMMTPCMKLACCKDKGIRADLVKTLDCIKPLPENDKVKKEIRDMAESYEPHKDQYCEADGKPKQAAIDAELKKQIKKYECDKKLTRFMPCACLEGEMKKLFKKYEKSCGI